MVKKEKIVSVRLSEDTLAKLDMLMELNKHDSESQIDVRMTKTDIMEEAIKELYFKKVNESQDADVVERIAELVHDEVNSSLTNLHKKIDEVLYLTIKNDLGNKLLYRSPNLIPSPKDLNDAIDIIVEPSRWDDALEEYLQNKEIRDIKNRAGGEE